RGRGRAARNGRSMEEEIRHILASADTPEARRGATILEVPRQAAPAVVPSGGPHAKRVLLVIGGGIAAYKSLDLIRRLKERGAIVRAILTKGGQEFITPLAVGAIAGERAFTDLFDPRGEFDVGHIRIARDTDLVVVAPATAD